MGTYAAYLRISKDPHGTSTAPQRQLADIRKFAELRGVEIGDVYEDTDLSAYRDVHRPAYEEMLEAVRQGAYDGVIVWKLDRLIRRITEFSRFWQVAQESSTSLVSVNDPIDTREPIGVAFVYLLVGLAEQEARNMGLRLRAKEAEMANAGARKTGGRRGYGMARDGTIVDAEAAIIREAADRVLAGEAVGAIARDLNDRKVPTAAGKRWTRRTLSTLLQQARLFGWREHRGELVAAGDWTPILDEATGRRLREIIPARTVRGEEQPTQRVTLLSGLLRCGKCGRGMKAASVGTRSETTRLQYRCPPVSEGGCGGITVDRSRVDDAVSEMVMHRLESPQLLDTLRARRNVAASTDDAALIASLAEHTSRAEDLAEAFADGEIDRAGYSRALAKLDHRIAQLNEQLAEASTRTAPAELVDGTVAAGWDGMTVGRQRAVLEVLLDRVVVHPLTSEYAIDRIRTSLRLEADEHDAAGDHDLAERRRRQAEGDNPGGGKFRPERLEPIWLV